MVSLRFPDGSILDGENVGGQHFCGGALIEKNIVLTAGHCLKPNGFTNVDVHIGRFEREGDDDGRFQAFKTIDTRIHPDFEFNSGWSNFDIALLVLDGESQVSPIAYAKNEDGLTTGTESTVIGWGRTEEQNSDSLSDRLLQAQVPIVGREECRNLFIDPALITTSMICAGKRGTDACQFDSGGPLLHNKQVVGLVSWGIGCGGDEPGVYSSIGATANWIESQIRDINQVSTTYILDFKCLSCPLENLFFYN